MMMKKDCEGGDDLDWMGEEEEALDDESSDEDDNMENDGTDPMVTTSFPNWEHRKNKRKIHSTQQHLLFSFRVFS